MKWWIYSLALFLSGCGLTTTNTETGKKKLFNAIPLPSFRSSPEQPVNVDPHYALMVEQLQPFVNLSLVLIVGGAFLWWSTNGRTGAGKFFVMLGVGLAVFAVVMPKIAGWLGLVAVIGAVVLTVYFIVWYLTKRKNKKNLDKN